MYDRGMNPKRYAVPKEWYSHGEVYVRAQRKRIQPKLPEDKERVRRYYESQLQQYPDILYISDIIKITGYSRRIIWKWIHEDKLHAYRLSNQFVVPKEYLIDWLCTDEYNKVYRKTKQHVATLCVLAKWRDKVNYQKVREEKD